MIGLAVICFLLGAALIVIGTRPGLAFYLDEGWKFRDATAPSETYTAVTGVAGLAGGIGFVVLGVVLLSQHSTVTAEDAALAAAQHCREQLLPRFDATVEWDGSRLANPDEVRSLATELGVDLVISAEDPVDGRGTAGDVVGVLDPNRPGPDKLAFRYLGEHHDEYWARPHTCQSYTAGLEN